MKFSAIIAGVTVSKMYRLIYGQMAPTQDIEISRVQYDSRKVTHGDLFVAIRGTSTDGHNFIEAAIQKGAVAIVLENDSALSDYYFLHSGVMKIIVSDSRKALAQLSANYFNHPSNNLKMIGVTGTNGKTTTTYLIKSILDYCGKKTGLIGTIDYRIGEKIFQASHTTPESLELQYLLKQMVDERCEYAVMEVSSHALHQNRVRGINFSVGIFTNLTQDHLDYHNTIEEYFNAKSILFSDMSPPSVAVINADDEWGSKIANCTKANVTTYGISKTSDVCADEYFLSIEGTKILVKNHSEKINLKSNLLGKFNLSNILAAFAACRAVGLTAVEIKDALEKISPVRGRFEQINSKHGWTAVIDYAHTPDALEKIIVAIRTLYEKNKSGKIITVFGCGGDRDRTKRQIMAEIATRLSDITVITSDNPRSEDPEKIIDEMIKGITFGSKVIRDADRTEAIKKAISFAGEGDVVLIAGKGHEEYQIIGSNKIPFSDKSVVESLK